MTYLYFCLIFLYVFFVTSLIFFHCHFVFRLTLTKKKKKKKGFVGVCVCLMCFFGKCWVLFMLFCFLFTKVFHISCFLLFFLFVSNVSTFCVFVIDFCLFSKLSIYHIPRIIRSNSFQKALVSSKCTGFSTAWNHCTVHNLHEIAKDFACQHMRNWERVHENETF